MSQLQLAELLRVSHQQVQKYEQGMTRISASTLYDIGRIMSVVPSFFYEGFNPTLPASNTIDDIISLERPKQLNILLVEDNASDEILTRKALEECDAEIIVHSVYDGIEALKCLRGRGSITPFQRPDIVLLDLNIPKKQGMEVLKEIKNDHELRHIPIIVLTNSINAQEMFETYRLYASGYITKSFDITRFNKNIIDMVEYWASAVILPSHFRM